MEHKTGCLVCGKELVYIKGHEKMQCHLCKQTFDGKDRKSVV
jgi:primosomal protein N'